MKPGLNEHRKCATLLGCKHRLVPAIPSSHSKQEYQSLAVFMG